MPVIILLSTYQGEKYVASQIDSIISQTCRDWVLYIRDDGSSDSTIDIIKNYAAKDARIHFLEDELGNIKPVASYNELMKAASAAVEDYILFCDQDDMWLPDKIALQIELLDKLTQQYGNNTPLLVHSDLCVVDTDLKTIHSSYLQYEHLKANWQQPLHTLLAANYVTGCTIGINRALLNICYPVPDKVIMHDWWCALCAAAAGKIGFISKATVLYRQHQANVIGSKGYYIKWVSGWKQRKNNFYRKFAQARYLSQQLGECFPDAELVNKFSQLLDYPFVKRIRTVLRMPIQYHTRLRKMLFLICLAVWDQADLRTSSPDGGRRS
jgi:glycosyltransferase involved in cell wall biosynthesis